MDVSGFCEVTLQTDDPARLARFYAECLGLTELSRDDKGVWLAVGRSARLGLWQPGAKEFGDRGGRHVHFALSVSPEGLDAIAQRLRDRRLEVRGPVEHEGGDRSLYLTDPEGNVVEMWDHFARGQTVAALDDFHADALAVGVPDQEAA